MNDKKKLEDLLILFLKDLICQNALSIRKVTFQQFVFFLVKGTCFYFKE